MALTQVQGQMIYPAQSGSVIQTVTNSVTSSNYASTSSTSYVTTGHSATITPQFSNSKILILVSAYCGFNYPSNPSSGGAFTIYRGGTNLSGGANNAIAALDFANSTGLSTTNLGISYVDSPATTSATTYTIYFYSNASSGTLTYCCSFGGLVSNSLATITLLEIAA